MECLLPVIKSVHVLPQITAESEHILSVNTRTITKERTSLAEKNICLPSCH